MALFRSEFFRIMPEALEHAKDAAKATKDCKGLRHGPSATSCQGPVLCMGVHGSVRRTVGNMKVGKISGFYQPE